MDVVLMDLQYTTAIVGRDKIKQSEDMVSRISKAAENAHVNVFRRFALMRRWVKDNIPMAGLVDPADPDKLHMSDWATNCITQALDGAIKGAPRSKAKPAA
jgi:acyl-CoA thioesterase I